ncbi:uncharacterized protein PpBr36_09944 [Pyricularia pennisetigena]|uniref:uncharacterized protein n=1 Tax=Pyricularia pennisetigena TaxID=1578925 RepID=UPI00114E0CED|nr:uncharacterized protein PpBr36_09944 [Pyricularia pennisetigena]TLS22529.1 hypothetical protein PpBr36_09944 [Pyricularia pennisetigena]
MHAASFLAILTSTSAGFVSANPVLGSEDPKAVQLERRAWPFTRRPTTPAVAQQPTTPPAKCPSFWSIRGSFQPTSDGHCCVPGDKDAINCCMLTATTHLPSAESELPCSNAYFSKPQFYQQLEACNTGKQADFLCRANRVPEMPEVKAKYAPNGRINQFGHSGTKKQHPGKSRLGQYPNGNPAPAAGQTFLEQGV